MRYPESERVNLLSQKQTTKRAWPTPINLILVAPSANTKSLKIQIYNLVSKKLTDTKKLTLIGECRDVFTTIDQKMYFTTTNTARNGLGLLSVRFNVILFYSCIIDFVK